jgi:small redox-active disulfide protein 2
MEKRMEIKVLGSGCANCKRLYQNTKDAVNKAGLIADVIYIDDLKVIAKMGIMRTPALVVDNRLASSGRVLTVEEIVTLLSSK